ncbi:MULTISPECIES: transposase [Pyramidobacter]|nr:MULTISPECIES: transposase [Pyramidobacter]WOL39839.1 transposase [Pyramidobacter sp. YE332]BDF79467.1 hypothetical protein CE91St28_22610 [Pyramidobacter piscolens]
MAAQTHPRDKECLTNGDTKAWLVAATRGRAEKIENVAYTLDKAPEHQLEKQQIWIATIAENSSHLCRAYRMKETLRRLLKIEDTNEVEADLKRWLLWTGYSKNPAFKKLYQKVKCH